MKQVVLVFGFLGQILQKQMNLSVTCAHCPIIDLLGVLQNSTEGYYFLWNCPL